MQAIISFSEAGYNLAKKITKEDFQAGIHYKPNKQIIEELFNSNTNLIFIGSLGICVRYIADLIVNKKSDPAIINIDVKGKYVQSVLSGHLGGANKLCKDISSILGAVPIISTVSDSEDLWSLDILPSQFDWTMETSKPLTKLMAKFVNKKPTALLIEARDAGTLHLEADIPEHVKSFTSVEDIDIDQYELIIAVSPFLHDLGENVIFYRPKMINIGVGCMKYTNPQLFYQEIIDQLIENKLSPTSISKIGTVDIKKDEEAILRLCTELDINLSIIEASILAKYEVPNPSEKVSEVTGSAGVAEAAAMHLSDNSLLIEKTKLKIGDKFATFSLALNNDMERKGFVEIVGAGPGDPKLVTVRGKHLLQNADLILYAGSLVPKELTEYAKPGCVVRSSASLDLNEQVDLMREFYTRKLQIVRLHTGDPCIYGAIQEQMNLMDKYKMNYRITPGVSSFQAAAAALKSQFTIPEEVQTIILTRGEGRTPMPKDEQLHQLAKSQSTMCIYLSASIADKVQADLSVHYPGDTPVAICYKLTWREEKIYRCTLDTLAKTVKDNNLSMTTLIVIGKAIDNRSGESKLYHKNFKHAFRS